MAKSKTRTKKTKSVVPSKTRVRKTPAYRSFKMTKRIKPPIQKKIPSVPAILRQTISHIWRNKKTFFGILLIYLVLNLIFVKGFASTVDISGLKQELALTANSGVNINLALVSTLFGSGNSAATEVGSLYQTVILILASLAFVWLFRHTNDDSDKKLTVRQPFYEGMAPLVPFLLVLCVVGLQLIPMVAGLGLLSTVLSNGLAVTLLEQVLWSLLALSLTLLTFYMISSSLFALIIVTLPDTTPMAALRSARKVVVFRRWTLMRKIFLMTILVTASFALIVFLSIIAVPFMAEWIFFIVSSVLVPIIIGFVYKMYRALL